MVTDVRREPDDEYRRRLAIYRPWLLRTRANVLGLLKGIDERLSIAERDNPFALAVHVVGAEEPALRDNFLEFVRQAHLIWPHPSADPVHAARVEPQDRADPSSRCAQICATASASSRRARPRRSLRCWRPRSHASGAAASTCGRRPSGRSAGPRTARAAHATSSAWVPTSRCCRRPSSSGSPRSTPPVARPRTRRFRR